MHMSQCNKQLPHVSSNVHLRKIPQVCNEISAFHKLKNQRCTVVFSHTIQKRNNVVARIVTYVRLLMHYKNKQNVASAQVLPTLTSSNISSSLWIVATPEEKMKKKRFQHCRSSKYQRYASGASHKQVAPFLNKHINEVQTRCALKGKKCASRRHNPRWHVPNPPLPIFWR